MYSPANPRNNLLLSTVLAALLFACQSTPSEAQTTTSSATSSPTSTATLVPSPTPFNNEFVTQQEGHLLLDGQPFRFVGTNAYFLQPEIVYGNIDGVAEVLDEMDDQDMTVVRIWAFNDSDPSADPASIQPEPGVYREESLVALDRAIAEAKKRNIRVILTLVNYFRDYGGIPRYLEWCDCDATIPDFYTNEQIKGWYRDYASILINRTNTVTGVSYRDESAILAWELGNELRNPGGRVEDWLAWHVDMAQFIKNLDPNHLVADGGEGMDNAPGLYPGLSNTYAVRGDESTSFHQLVQVPEIDMISIHLYPDHWGLNADADVEIWLRVHAELARQAGKVIYLGEYGIQGEDATRAAVFDRWLNIAFIENDLAGALVWGLVYDQRPDYDGLSIYCATQIETCNTLQRYAAQISNTGSE